VQHFILQY